MSNIDQLCGSLGIGYRQALGQCPTDFTPYFTEQAALGDALRRMGARDRIRGVWLRLPSGTHRRMNVIESTAGPGGFDVIVGTDFDGEER